MLGLSQKPQIQGLNTNLERKKERKKKSKHLELMCSRRTFFTVSNANRKKKGFKLAEILRTQTECH